MSIFNEVLGKVNEIYAGHVGDLKDHLQSCLAALDKFGEEYMKSKGAGTEKGKNATAVLQSINEDDDEPSKLPEAPKRRSSKAKPLELAKHSDSVSVTEKPESYVEESIAAKQRSKKRSKDEVDGMCSPEQDKRPKRNASVRAQGVISKQVNVNLSSKLRREDSALMKEETRRRRKGQADNDSDKENSEPVVKVKEEKISLPLEEPMDVELNIDIKVEPDKDEISMPPPAAPVPKPRGRPAKERQKEKEQEKETERADESSEDEGSARRRNTRNRKQTDTDTMPPPPAPSSRSTRASSKASVTQSEEMPPPPPAETRPKRTRAKKKTDLESSQPEPEKTTSSQENAVASPTEKPRPKRTRRGKATQKEQPDEQPKEPAATKGPTIVSPKEERISSPTPDVSSPILQKEINVSHKETKSKSKKMTSDTTDGDSQVKPANLEETRIISTNEMNVTVNICNGVMDKTVVLPNGKYNHGPSAPKKTGAMDRTVVLESNGRDTFVVEKPPQNHVNDTTVVIEKDPKPTNVTDDNSLMTDDNSDHEASTPPRPPPQLQPTSAVKEKVQQFEELASRVTRTKTRAMAKKEPSEEEENHTPPDKIGKAILSADTLSKMNNLIFNGKAAPQISSSASKPRANIVTTVKSQIPASASKLCSLSKAREAAEEVQRKEREKENAKRKKEALLEAKKEAQRRKREEKMAAAAAAREAAERERQLAIEAAARERVEKQAHADMGKLERAREQERKKLELLRKAAVTEERRLADERARQQRLAEEQKRAELARKKQHEEQEATKKEAALMAKEIEKRQKEYLEKQKMKLKMESEKTTTPLKMMGAQNGLRSMEPVYMADGFDQLHSDSDCEDAPRRPVPVWSTSKVRLRQLKIQSYIKQSHIDRLFWLRVHSPDLRDIFPNIERQHLKRTSSAVWRTPPGRLHTLQE